jgi:cytochrome c biogenesis protein CcmG/thiol:disulfide interchange protein DsbE
MSGIAMVGLFGRWLGTGALAALAGLVLYGVTHRAAAPGIDERLSLGAGTPAPGFSLPVLSAGASRGLAAAGTRRRGVGLAALHGRPFVLNFWSSWCAPCLDELPLLERSWRQSRSDAVLVGVDQQDVRPDAMSVIRRFRLSFPVLRDVSDTTARRYGVTGTPETFFVSRRGVIVGHVIGEVTGDVYARGVAAAVAGRPLPDVAGGPREKLR